MTLLTITAMVAPGACLWIGYLLGERHGRALGLLRARTIAIEVAEEAASTKPDAADPPSVPWRLLPLAKARGASDVSERLRRESEGRP